MTSNLVSFLLQQSWRFRKLARLASCQVVGLLYHGVSKGNDSHSISIDQFERHLKFMVEHFQIVTPREVFLKRTRKEKIRVVLTFDDGFNNHAEYLAPLLSKYQIPAMFFVSSRHAQPGKYLWFNYLRALKRYFPGESIEFHGKSYDMTPAHRELSVSGLTQELVNLKPHPMAMYDAIDKEMPSLESFVPADDLRNYYSGMSVEQLAALAQNPYFCIAAHTVNHPYLTKCDADASFRELQDNKLWIEGIIGHRCEAIAYPSGDYDRRVLEQCRQLGFTQGYSIAPRLGVYRNLEIPRLGLYDPSVDVLGFKVHWGVLARSLGVPIG